MTAPQVQHPGIEELGRIGEQRRAARDPEPASAAPSTDPETEGLRAQLAEAQERERQSQELLRQALGSAHSQAAEPAASAPEIPPDPGPAPDPGSEPQAHGRWLQQMLARERAITQASIQQTRDDAVRNVRADQVLQAFVMKHPEWDGFTTDVVEAFNTAMGQLGLRTIPQDVVLLEKTAHSILEDKKKRLLGDAAPATPAVEPGSRAPEHGDPPTRTAGVSGGSSNRPTPPSEVPGEEDGVKIVPFDQQFQNLQAQSDFF